MRVDIVTSKIDRRLETHRLEQPRSGAISGDLTGKRHTRPQVGGYRPQPSILSLARKR